MDVWKAKRMPSKLNKDVTTHFASTLWKGVEEGYGAALDSFDFDTPDYLMLRRLKDSVWHFSAAKNYAQLKALSEALVDDKMKLRSWRDFKEEAYKINQDHVGRWLKAEYEMAVASSQMASTWTRFQENAKELPLLRFDAVNDNRTTEICKSLDGVIRLISDTFWSIYFPPNHWGPCRSDVQQLANGQITPASEIITPEKMPEMFKTNLADKGIVFPDGHPYYIGNPAFVKEQARAIQMEFKPVGTLKEAEVFALENGLAKKVSYKGLNHVGVANDVNKVLLELKNESGITYNEINVKQATRRGRPTFIMQNGASLRQKTVNGVKTITGESYSLTINKAHFNSFDSYEAIIADIKRLREAKWTTGENIEHITWHEVGHRLTVKNTFEKASLAKLERKVFDYDRLGKYASTDFDETLAEIYSYYRKTGSLPDEWRELFNKWSLIQIK